MGSTPLVYCSPRRLLGETFGLGLRQSGAGVVDLHRFPLLFQHVPENWIEANPMNGQAITPSRPELFPFWASGPYPSRDPEQVEVSIQTRLTTSPLRFAITSLP